MTPSSTTASPPAGDRASVATVLIRPRPGWRAVDLGELWRYRELLWILAGRDVRIRYK